MPAGLERNSGAVAPEGNKLPKTEPKRVAQLTKLRRDLAAVLNANGIDSLLGVKDKVLAEYLLRVLMGLSKMIDNIHELEK